MLTEIISLCFASYFFNGCASGKNMNASLKKKQLENGGLKIRYVSPQKIRLDYVEFKNAKKKSEEEKAKITEELNKVQIDIQNLVKSYEKKNILLSQEEKKEREGEIIKKQGEYNQLRQIKSIEL